jgi:large subunit ribosomal protein L27
MTPSTAPVFAAIESGLPSLICLLLQILNIIPKYLQPGTIITTIIMSFSLLNRRLVPTSLSSPFSSGFVTTVTRTMATKKQGGSTNNGRDSIGRRLGVKATQGQQVTAGSIIVRQRGQKYRAGENAGMGKDHTVFAKYDGTVHFTRLDTRKKRSVVNILLAQ